MITVLCLHARARYGNGWIHMARRCMISVVIPTLNASTRFSACLEALVGSAIGGVVHEVIIVDGGSTDATVQIADAFGAKVLTAKPGRGGQLHTGAGAAKGHWLLFLHDDTVLDEEWVDDALDCIRSGDHKVGVFTLQFDASGIAPRIVAAGAMFRTKYFQSPYGDQGLLISKQLYEEIGGFRDMPLFEDVDIIRRLVRAKGRDVLRVLEAKAVTSADRYEREGYYKRVLKNFWLLLRYYAGASPEALARAYR